MSFPLHIETTTLISSQREQSEVHLDLSLGSHGTATVLRCVSGNPDDPRQCQLYEELSHAPNTTENKRGWNIYGRPEKYLKLSVAVQKFRGLELILKIDSTTKVA